VATLSSTETWKFKDIKMLCTKGKGNVQRSSTIENTRNPPPTSHTKAEMIYSYSTAKLPFSHYCLLRNDRIRYRYYVGCAILQSIYNFKAAFLKRRANSFSCFK
jgi:hypothetical protein